MIRSERNQIVQADVLVIGAGAAGIRAALAAAQEGAHVLMVTSKPVGRSGSTFSSVSGGWGIQALVGEERTEEHLEHFYDDILRAGLNMADPRLVRILVEESGPRLEDLMVHGLRFKKNARGEVLRVRGCFSECPRAFLTEDPRNIKDAFMRMLDRSGTQRMTGRAVDLIQAEGVCRGAWVVTAEGETIQVEASATILATGGGAGLFQDHMVADEDVGDGYALAHRAGAEMKNLEFIQFMIGIAADGGPRFFPLERLLSPGALIDEEGRDLLELAVPHDTLRDRAVRERQTHHPFSSRDSSHLVDMAIAEAARQGRRVFWKPEGPPQKTMEVRHFAHAFNGGLRIDERAQTTLPGLFAAGEVATGSHGADRIGGCMMTATQVFGERAGRFAARFAGKNPSFPAGSSPPVNQGRRHPGGTTGRELVSALKALRRATARELTVVRDKHGLTSCLAMIADTKEVMETRREGTSLSSLKGRDALCVMELIASSALERDESLGAHFRSDFPPAAPRDGFPPRQRQHPDSGACPSPSAR